MDKTESFTYEPTAYVPYRSRQHTNSYQDIQSAKAGDTAAFERLVKNMEQTLYRVARTQLNPVDDCADAIQESIIKIWLKLGSLREIRYFQTWSIRILINECRKIARRRNTGIMVVSAEIPNNTTRDPELIAAINSLDNRERLPLVLHYIEGFTTLEIGRILSIPQGTVKTRLLRARKQLYEILSEEGQYE